MPSAEALHSPCSLGHLALLVLRMVAATRRGIAATWISRLPHALRLFFVFFVVVAAAGAGGGGGVVVVVVVPLLSYPSFGNVWDLGWARSRWSWLGTCLSGHHWPTRRWRGPHGVHVHTAVGQKEKPQEPYIFSLYQGFLGTLFWPTATCVHSISGMQQNDVPDRSKTHEKDVCK